MRDQSEPSPSDPGDQSRRIGIRWGVWSAWLFALMRLHPLATDWFNDGKSGVLLTAMECVLIQSVAVSVWLVFLQFRRQNAASNRINSVGRIVSALPSVLLSVDLWVFHLTGMHATSSGFGSLLTSLPGGIVGFFSWGVAVTILPLGIAWCVGWMACSKLEKLVMGRKKDPSRLLPASVALANTMLLLTLTQGGPISNRFPGWSEGLRKQSSRHPLIAMGWLSRDVSLSNLIPAEEPFSIAAEELKRMADQRISQMRMNVVVESDSVEVSALSKNAGRPDVLIVIGESLRSELLSEDVMPATFDLTRRGTWLKQHYSGGNSSSLGVFSIVSGLEAIWFYKSNVRFAPAMNRLFKQAGYELGFFASTNDWSVFQMDAFLSESKYDVFESNDFEGLQSDRDAIDAAKRFLDNDSQRPPRLAVLCLYGTHAPFSSDPALESDQPAAGDGYPIPFPPSWRESVWNRYRNAARTLDASMASLLEDHANQSGRRNRVTVVTGDHGESFGEDGTIGHGTRLSSDQTRSLAVIAGPGIPHVQRDQITHHCDWLPTLLSAAGVRTSMPEQFDGIDLTEDANLREDRIVSISSYTGKEIAILNGNSTMNSSSWAELCEFSLMHGTASLQYRIGPKGGPQTVVDDSPPLMKRWFETVPFVR